MAINFVDRSALDASLLATANKIRNKTKMTGTIQFNLSGRKGFADAIDAIKSVYDADVSYKFGQYAGSISPGSGTYRVEGSFNLASRPKKAFFAKAYTSSASGVEYPMITALLKDVTNDIEEVTLPHPVGTYYQYRYTTTFSRTTSSREYKIQDVLITID